MTDKQFFYILFVSHGIALAKHIVKQDKEIFFQFKKKNSNHPTLLTISGRKQV